MRKALVLAGVVAVLAVWALYVGAQEQPATEKPAAMEHAGHMMPQMGQGTGDAEKPAMSHKEMMAQCKAHMKSMGMSDAMMMRHKMLMSAAVSSDDPVALLAVRDDLKLTDDQITKIAAISLAAREDARAALTDEQKKTLATLAGTPATMMDMCAQMHKKMADSGQGMMCPMMGGMGKMGEGKDPQPMSCCPMMGTGAAATTKTETK